MIGGTAAGYAAIGGRGRDNFVVGVGVALAIGTVFDVAKVEIGINVGAPFVVVLRAVKLGKHHRRADNALPAVCEAA